MIELRQDLRDWALFLFARDSDQDVDSVPCFTREPVNLFDLHDASLTRWANDRQSIVTVEQNI